MNIRTVLEIFVRKRWKEVGLGLLNLSAIVLVIVLFQPVLRKFGASGAPILAFVCLVIYISGNKWIERRSPTELLPSRALPEVAAGFGIGLLLFSMVMAILLFLGVYRPLGWGSAQHLASGLVFALLAAVTEEILFRGLLFRLTSRIIGTWGALLFTSAFFGLAHVANPGATFRSSVAIALEAGLLLGAAYAATQRLWLPIGLHVGWNFTEGSIFGMNISGTDAHEGLLRGSLHGQPLLTGGAFGPEASAIAVLVCMAAALFFLWRTLQLNRVEPPAFRKTPDPPVMIETS